MARSAALVTGGARRIGAAICLHLAEKGHSVAVHHNSSSDDAEALVERIRSLGVEACAIQADLSDAGAVESLLAKASEEIGPITHLVNNASKFEHDDIESVNYESWGSHMDVNARAPMLLTRALLEQLPNGAAGGAAGSTPGTESGPAGSVVNILDQKIADPNPDHLSYTASRYALLGLTDALARGLAPRLRVNAVAPGHTLASNDQTAEGFERAQSESPLGFGPAPEDIAEAVGYLVGARAVTGQVLFVDSGERFLARSRDVLFETEGGL